MGSYIYSLREGGFPRAIFAGEAIGGQDSALTSPSDRRGKYLVPLGQKGRLCLLPGGGEGGE